MFTKVAHNVPQSFLKLNFLTHQGEIGLYCEVSDFSSVWLSLVVSDFK